MESLMCQGSVALLFEILLSWWADVHDCACRYQSNYGYYNSGGSAAAAAAAAGMLLPNSGVLHYLHWCTSI